jgi:DNA-directed RNA polymerase specialized sigma24 family protein
VRLTDFTRIQWQDRRISLPCLAQVMRRILVDHARRRNASAAAAYAHVSLDDTVVVAPEPSLDLVALDDALKALARVDARKAQVVEMRFFGGLSVEESAAVLRCRPSPSCATGERRRPGSIVK